MSNKKQKVEEYKKEMAFVRLAMNQEQEKKFIEEVEEAMKILEQRIKDGKLKISKVEERIITPDQMRPHQFGYF